MLGIPRPSLINGPPPKPNRQWWSRADRQGIPDISFYLIPLKMRVVAIQHVKTRYFVAMNANGKLYCQATFNADCKFKENIFENYWNIYARLASIEDVVQNVRLKRKGY